MFACESAVLCDASCPCIVFVLVSPGRSLFFIPRHNVASVKRGGTGAGRTGGRGLGGAGVGGGGSNFLYMA